MAGTYRLRYRAPADEHGKAPEVQYDGFDGLPDKAEAKAAPSGSSSKARRAMAAAKPAPAAYSSARHQPSQQRHQQPGYEPAWALPAIPGRTKKGKLSGFDGGNGTAAAEAFLVVQAVVAEETRNATWVEEALKGYLRPYLRAEEENVKGPAATETRRRLMAAMHTATPFQMPRRYLPAGDRCNDSALLWPAHFTLHLANASTVYPVINKLHALLVRAPATEGAAKPTDVHEQQQQPQQQQPVLPRLCSVNVTLLNSGFSAAADGRTAAAPARDAAATTAAARGVDDGASGAAEKVPPKVVLMLAFAGGACLILLGFFAYRQLAYGAGIGVSSSGGGGGGRHRGSRRSSVQHLHDPTTIEQQITELDDSLSAAAVVGVKASALRHNSRSRNNSMTGLHAHPAIFPPPRLPARADPGSHRLSGSISISGSGGATSVDLSGSSPATGGGGGPGGGASHTVATATTVGSIAHFRSSSSLPTDLDAQESHGRSASLPHNGFGFFLPRRSSFHNSNGSTSQK